MRLIGANKKDLRDLTMFMGVAAVLFLFLIDLHFLHLDYVAETIQKRSGQGTVKKLRKLRKRDY